MRSRHLFKRVAIAIASTCSSVPLLAAPSCIAPADPADATPAEGDWYATLAHIERARACAPTDRALLRARVMAISAIGSNDTAWRWARASEGLVDAATFDQLTSKRLARLIGWSEVGRDESARLAAAQQALQESTAYLAQVIGKDSTAVMRTRLDRLLLLNRLGQHQQVADEQALLRREGVAVPPYLIGAVSIR